ncbi:hypothetical protein LL912_18780 [Niabella sp. CC-SYL272]|uniref:hypothetical protein n=1 Tax=Niabella agricola TaxID=2891571 RepID=UPI001F3AEC32|nr:hypothetical protein [Niabella agricola]MCF3110837.1 hypothetical protein [Niabella agricola]
MKQRIFLLLLTTGYLVAGHTFGQAEKGSTQGVATNEMLITSGTYFIINGNAALTPEAASLGQNVFLKPFRRSGLQKWMVTKSATEKNITYTIKLAGDAEDLWFQPFPSGNDHTPVVSYKLDNVSYKITPVPGKAGLWYIKSIKRNGDALRSYMSDAASPLELRFEPIEEGNAKFYWKFEAAGE